MRRVSNPALERLLARRGRNESCRVEMADIALMSNWSLAHIRRYFNGGGPVRAAAMEPDLARALGCTIRTLRRARNKKRRVL